MNDNHNKPVELSLDEKNLLVERKATCPFIGSALAQGELSVRNDVKNPLASIEDVKTLGNTGGGDLGDLLVVFASKNHASMRGEYGKLDKSVPSGLFSLEFPGSLGSHLGHSGILQGDPTQLDSGRLSEADFARLTNRAKDGWIKRSDVGCFIAENLLKDSAHVLVFEENTSPQAGNRFEFKRTDDSTLNRGERDDLVRSAGEFGLLFAFLVNKPDAREVDGEPAIAIQDLKTMFVDKHLPDGWETWKKLQSDWISNATGLLISAGKEYLALKQSQ